MTNKYQFLTGRESFYLEKFQEYLVHKDIIDPLQNLIQDAKSEIGAEIEIISSFRDFDRQQHIWNAKATGDRPITDETCKTVDPRKVSPIELIHKIMRFSAVPGLSRHHWGTDIDIFDSSKMNKEDVCLIPEECSGPFRELHEWLDDKIADNKAHGFFRPYDCDLNGVAVEKWHISYAPLAQEYYHLYTIDLFIQNLKDSEIELKDTLLEHAESLFNQYFKNIVLP
mgnify:CR=1 FL=1